MQGKLYIKLVYQKEVNQGYQRPIKRKRNTHNFTTIDLKCDVIFSLHPRIFKICNDFATIFNIYFWSFD